MDIIEKFDDLEFQDEENEEIKESSADELGKIVSYNVANTVEVLKFKIDNNEIDLKPEFQRDFVWDINRASLFIDSLLIGLPIPSIFLGKSKDDETYKVIDGQQRLKYITIYVLATRFLEGSVKQIIYNCCIMRGDTPVQLTALDSELKKFNNPEYSNIHDEVLKHLNFNITGGFNNGSFTSKDISFLNEIVRNRHRNVHASYDSSTWYSKNLKDITNDFQKEYIGLLNILSYLDRICWDGQNGKFHV